MAVYFSKLSFSFFDQMMTQGKKAFLQFHCFVIVYFTFFNSLILNYLFKDCLFLIGQFIYSLFNILETNYMQENNCFFFLFSGRKTQPMSNQTTMWGLLSKHTRWLEIKVEKYKRRGSQGIFFFFFFYFQEHVRLKVDYFLFL